MKNADQPIFPCMMQQVGESEYRAHKDGDAREWRLPVAGLTKRELFAAMAMQGELASYGPDPGPRTSSVARFSVEMADALIAELNKPQT